MIALTRLELATSTLPNAFGCNQLGSEAAEEIKKRRAAWSKRITEDQFVNALSLEAKAYEIFKSIDKKGAENTNAETAVIPH